MIKLIKQMCESNEKEVARKVMATVKDALDAAETRDRVATIADINKKAKDGWDINDIVDFVMCDEAINPDIDEDEACKKISKLTAKYGRH